MQLRSLLVGGSILVTALAMNACSSGTGGTGGGAPGSCEASGTRICERACACGSGSCKTGIRNSFGSFTTFTWSDAADCEGGYASSRCKNGGSPGVDYGACTTEVDATACEGDVFVVPASCEAAKDAGR